MPEINLADYEPLVPTDDTDDTALETELVITAEDGDDRTYRLLTPLNVNGEWLRIVKMRLPTQDDIDAWGNGDVASLRELFCRLASLDPRVAKALRWHDSAALHQIFHDIVPDFITGG